MTTVRVVRSLGSTSQFMRAARRKGATETARRLEAVARASEQAFDEIVGNEFANDRDPSRRKTGRHLVGSSHAEILWDSDDFPVEIQISSLAESGKVNALNSGADPHPIYGSPWLVFPVAEKRKTGASNKSSARGVNRARSKRAGSRRANPTVRTDMVDHPGNAPHYFLQRALERAVNAAYAKAIRLKR